MRTTNVFHSVWTLREGQQTVHEHEYKEFRFAELVGAPPNLSAADIEAWVVRYPFGDEGEAEVEDEDESTSTKRRTAIEMGMKSTIIGVPSGVTKFTSSLKNLDRVFEFTQYTNVAASTCEHSLFVLC
jgi:hypothetical protein